ncbi:hypothetical protein BS47DRAFT_189988 [Hydnum rufescens UP504]|uniref:Uncharacterized protein n=1 Tax=Hydnum rufescens UP504 TaxID=1448309 RepID=A0A9P6AN94_9AGAM|nr:hypothetical protein BS47DRAFT_189988 [Hydnum rufescens UP504]
MNRHTRSQTVPFGYAPHYEAPAGAPPGAFYSPAVPHGNQPEITVQTPAQEAPAIRPWDASIWRPDAPPQTQVQQVPATMANSKEEALLGLSERKTQLEIAKEKYRIEKQKWKEEKEARRLARDREIERLTGRRVLSREERRRERERHEIEGDRDIPQINARARNPGEHEYHPDQKHPAADDLPTERDERPEHIGDTVVSEGRFGPKPTNTKTLARPHILPAWRLRALVTLLTSELGSCSTVLKIWVLALLPTLI